MMIGAIGSWLFSMCFVVVVFLVVSFYLYCQPDVFEVRFVKCLFGDSNKLLLPLKLLFCYVFYLVNVAMFNTSIYRDYSRPLPEYWQGDGFVEYPMFYLNSKYLFCLFSIKRLTDMFIFYYSFEKQELFRKIVLWYCVIMCCLASFGSSLPEAGHVVCIYCIFIPYVLFASVILSLMAMPPLVTILLKPIIFIHKWVNDNWLSFSNVYIALLSHCTSFKSLLSLCFKSIVGFVVGYCSSCYLSLRSCTLCYEECAIVSFLKYRFCIDQLKQDDRFLRISRIDELRMEFADFLSFSTFLRYSFVWCARIMRFSYTTLYYFHLYVSLVVPISLYLIADRPLTDWILHCDKEYAYSKAARRDERAVRARQRCEKSKAISETVAKEKRRSRLCNSLSAKRMQLEALNDRFSELGKTMLDYAPESVPTLLVSLREYNRLGKQIFKVNNQIVKLSLELEDAAKQSESAVTHLMSLHGDFLDLRSQIANVVPDTFVGKFKIVASIYSKFKFFLLCKTSMDYIDWCIGLISDYVPEHIIQGNMNVIEELFTKRFSAEPVAMDVQSLRTVVDLPNRPLTKILKYALGIIVVLTASCGLVDRENLPGFINFALDLPKQIEATDSLAYVWKAMNFCVKTLPFYGTGVRWRDLLNGTTPEQIMAAEVCILSQQHNLWLHGDPNENTNACAKLPLPECYSRCLNLEERMLSNLKLKKGTEVVVLRRELERVSEWKNTFAEKIKAEEIVVQPYLLAFCSTPGVGKTSLQHWITKLIAKNNGFPCGPDDISAINPDDKYFHSWKSILLFDDFHQAHVEKRVVNEALFILRCANSQRMMAVSADLAAKGRVPLNPNVMALSTNELEIRVDKDITEQTAFYRRINLEFSNIKPRPEFLLQNSICLDTAKANNASHCDIWEMRCGYYEVSADGAGNPRAVRMYYKQDFSVTNKEKEAYMFKLSELIPFIVTKSRNHFLNQRKFKASMENIGKDWHEHDVNGIKTYFPPTICTVCNNSTVVPGNIPIAPPVAPVLPSTNPFDALVASMVPMPQNMVTHSLQAFSIPISLLATALFTTKAISWFVSLLPPKVSWFLYRFVVWGICYYTSVVLLQIIGLMVSGFNLDPSSWAVKYAKNAASYFLADCYHVAKMKVKQFFKERYHLIALVVSLAGILLCYKMTMQGDEVKSDDEIAFGNKPDEWAQQNVNYEIILNDKKTTSYDDVCKLFKNSMLYFDCTYDDGATNRGNMVPYKGYYYLMNTHYIKQGRLPTLFMTRYHINAPQSRYVQKLTEDFIYRIPDSDISVVFIPKGMRCTDLSGFFTNRMPTLPVSCHFWYKTNVGIVEEETVKTVPASCFADNRFVPSCASYTKYCVPGMCGSLLMSVSKRPVPLYMHWAGARESWQASGSGNFINKDWVEKGIAHIEKNTGIANGGVPVNLSIQGLEEAPLSGKRSFSYTGTTGSLTYLGASTLPVDNNRKVCVRKTELHDEVLDKFAFPKPRGPTVTENWRPVFDAQEAMKHPGQEEPNWSMMKMARDDYLAGAMSSRAVRDDLINLRVLSNQEALDGTNVPGEEKLKLDTSIGLSFLGVGGKKNKHFSRDPLTGVTTPPEKFFDKTKEIEDTYDRGHTNGMPFSQTLKQEVLFKNKARIFSVNSVEYLVVMRKYFLTLCSLMRRHNEIFENVIGANVYGPDWDKIVKIAVKFGKDRLGYGDYKHYDQSLRCIEILVGFSIMIEFAEASGNFSARDIRIMWGIAHDIANPMYVGNGIVYGASGSGPSGHALTTILNNITNCIRFRVVYYTANKQLAKPIYDRNASPDFLFSSNLDLFRRNVSLLVHGDDNVFSVREGIQFGMKTLQKVLADMGVIYTDASKSDAVIDRELGGLDDFSFLKRGIGFIDGIPQPVAPLDVKSIWKPVMMHVPSKELTSSQQLALAISDAMRESFYHGRDYYNESKEFLQKIIVGKEVEIFVDKSAFCTYDSRVFDWRATFAADEGST